MKDKIISKAGSMFLKLGFKSVTMDDIATEMGISKKTIYKFFDNKELLIAAASATIHTEVHQIIADIVAQNFNAIAENFEIRKMFKEMFKASETSPIYQLKKHYPAIYEEVMFRETNACNKIFFQNIQKGIGQKLYRKDLNIDTCVRFYYALIFSINGSVVSEKEVLQLELEALEYHTRAMATPKGIQELENQLANPNI